LVRLDAGDVVGQVGDELLEVVEGGVAHGVGKGGWAGWWGSVAERR
jgi:hypothetical protein